MKTSELVRLLNNNIEKYGDREVSVAVAPDKKEVGYISIDIKPYEQPVGGLWNRKEDVLLFMAHDVRFYIGKENP